MPEKARKTPELAFAIFLVVMLLVMIFPIYALGDSAQPIVIGLPFSMFWIVFWTLVQFVGLIVFFLYEFRR